MWRPSDPKHIADIYEFSPFIEKSRCDRRPFVFSRSFQEKQRLSLVDDNIYFLTAIVEPMQIELKYEKS
jgi:hypothetical protein